MTELRRTALWNALVLAGTLDEETQDGPSLLLDALLELVGAERGVVLGLDPRTLHASREIGRKDAPATVSRALVGRALESPETISAEDAPIGGPARLVAATRLVFKKVVVGVVAIEKPSLEPWTNDQLVGLRAIARFLAPLVEALDGRAAVARELARERERVRAFTERPVFPRLLGDSPSMKEFLRVVGRAALSEAPVLLLGESGTGKEQVTRTLHENGPRREGPLVAVNMAAIPDTLLDTELFGYVKGAFTGADKDKPGLMRDANGGTLFLDEVGELSPIGQAKLLRALQEEEVRPVGGTQTFETDVRIVAATNRDLRAMVERGEFREDLFFRLNVVTLRVPPLRERGEDVILLALHSLEKLGSSRGLAEDAREVLRAHAWPGNVRELENVLEGALVCSEGEGPIRACDLPVRRVQAPTKPVDPREELLAALQANEWVVLRAAKALGVSPRTVYRRLEELGIALPELGWQRRPRAGRASA